MATRLSRAAKTEIVCLLHTDEIHSVSREFSFLSRLLDEGIDADSVSDEAYEICTTNPSIDAFVERLFVERRPLEILVVRGCRAILPAIVEEFLRQTKPCKFRSLTLTHGERSRSDLLRWTAVAEAVQRPCGACTSRGRHKAHEIHHVQNDATGQAITFDIELGVVDVSQAGWRSFRCKGLLRRVTVHLGDRLPCPQLAVFPKDSTFGRIIPLVFDNVFPFLDRVEIDKCMLVCRQWNDLIRRFDGILPLHNLLAVRFYYGSLQVMHAPANPDEDGIAYDFRPEQTSRSVRGISQWLRNSYVQTLCMKWYDGPSLDELKEVLTIAKCATDGISGVGRFAIDYEYTKEQLSDMLTWAFKVMRIRTFEISMRMSLLMENIAFLFENDVLRSSETVHLCLENDLDEWDRVPVEHFTQLLVAFSLESTCERLTITYYFGVPPFDVDVVVEPRRSRPYRIPYRTGLRTVLYGTEYGTATSQYGLPYRTVLVRYGVRQN
ncbi:hypothetical protein AAVH_15849 [Aphelenchoides avenae]|nr:hypothetical protein AAVH_15849 [Aphelenchus avenae]